MSDLDLLLRQIADPSELAWNEETYDLALATELTGADRATLIAKLIEQGQQGDTRAILTLGHLQADEALPWLSAAGLGAEPWAPTVRRALVLLGRGADVVDQIATDAFHAPTKMARVAAVLALATVGGAIAIDALEQALTDEAYEVRMLAWDGLIATLGLEPYLRDPEGKRRKTTQLELLKDFLASDLQTLVRMGGDELSALTKRLRRGASPEALGLTWKPHPAPELRARITQAMVDRDLPYPVDEMAQLTGLARRWAEAALVFRLGQDEPDPRVAAALVRLRATWTAPVLDEVAAASRTAPALAAELRQAANALRGR